MKKNPVVAALQREQASALVLYLNYKKYHWLTFGPNFRDLHLLFEEHATQVLDTVDEFAERSLMIDGKPLADPSRYIPASLVPPSGGRLQVALHAVLRSGRRRCRMAPGRSLDRRPLDVGERNSLRERGQVVRPHLRRRFVTGREPDQRRLAEGAAEEADAQRSP